MLAGETYREANNRWASVRGLKGVPGTNPLHPRAREGRQPGTPMDSLLERSMPAASTGDGPDVRAWFASRPGRGSQKVRRTDGARSR